MILLLLLPCTVCWLEAAAKDSFILYRYAVEGSVYSRLTLDLFWVLGVSTWSRKIQVIKYVHLYEALT